MKRKKLITKAATLITGVAVLVSAIYIMLRREGLQDNLDFGAGAYYYADIPAFDKYLKWDAYTAQLPYWVYVLLFLLWGALMYLLWIRIDGRGKK